MGRQGLLQARPRSCEHSCSDEGQRAAAQSSRVPAYAVAVHSQAVYHTQNTSPWDQYQQPAVPYMRGRGVQYVSLRVGDCNDYTTRIAVALQSRRRRDQPRALASALLNGMATLAAKQESAPRPVTSTPAGCTPLAASMVAALKGMVAARRRRTT